MTTRSDRRGSTPARSMPPARPPRPRPRIAWGFVIGFALALLYLLVRHAVDPAPRGTAMVGSPPATLGGFITMEFLLGWIPAWGVIWGFVDRRWMAGAAVTGAMCVFLIPGAFVVEAIASSEGLGTGTNRIFAVVTILIMTVPTTIWLTAMTVVCFVSIWKLLPSIDVPVVPSLVFIAAWVLGQFVGFIVEWDRIFLAALARVGPTILACYLMWRFSSRWYPTHVAIRPPHLFIPTRTPRWINHAAQMPLRPIAKRPAAPVRSELNGP